jgi:peptidyl-prolyl cis-trans isomerase D
VHDKIVADLKQQKAVQVAQSKAAELEKRVKAGEKFDAAAKALGLEPKTSEFFARSGNIPGVGSGKQFAAAFSMSNGQVATPVNMGANWVVYVVADKTEPNPADFDKQKKQITDSLLQAKRSVAFDAFRTTLEARLKKSGELKLNQDKMRGFGDLGSPLGPPIS